MIAKCPTCETNFNAKRKDSKYCSRLCYRRNPEVAKTYSKRTSAYQKIHSKEIDRRYQKLKYKCSHEKRNLSISLYQFREIMNNPCIYCNKSLKEETGCSLDRIDNKLDYSKENVVPCCGACNQIRNVHLTYDEMKVAMRAIVEYRNGKQNKYNR